MCFATLIAHAQNEKPFDVEIYNDEYKVSIKMNLYDKNITVPRQEVYGELDGFISSKQSSSVWLITSSKIINDKTAEIEVVNDYGSEDFIATLKLNENGTYTLDKTDGSTLKFAVNRKWQKLPGKVVFTKK